MNLAFISEANFRGKVTSRNYNVFDWIGVFDGKHFPYTDTLSNWEMLDEYDVVMLSDSDRRLDAAISIARHCKNTKTTTVWYPEGAIGTFLRMPFDHQRMLFELLEHVDLIGAVEEDRIPWYEMLWGPKVFHLTMPLWMPPGGPCNNKTFDVLACCNLGLDEIRYHTNVITTLAVLKDTEWKCVFSEVPENQVWFFREVLNIKMQDISRIDEPSYISQVLGPARVLMNLSRIVGTSRNSIMGAAVGTPVIGNRDSHTQMKLWPELAFQCEDAAGIKLALTKLLSDPGFYSDLCEYARTNLEYYSTENATKRFLEAVEKVK